MYKGIRMVIILAAVLTLVCGCGEQEKTISLAETGEITEEQQSTEAESLWNEEMTVLEPETDVVVPETIVLDMDWSGYFDGMNGAAVFYKPSEHCYQMYNQELANTRRSPCSTFKIISSLIGLEKQILIPEDSVREWSGEVYWNEEWNRNIDFEDAFQSSCVWYYRQLIDDIGENIMQAELDALQYGNCDISDWEGRLNTNNQNRALTGFWIESSLLISPKEQAEVMERIFGEQSEYSEQTIHELKNVMRNAEQDESGVVVYGKTGMGKANGVVADAWYTGFADRNGERVYFCVYLGESPGKSVSSTKAKEIAIELLRQ